jgi:hypothetical protein
MKKIYSFVMVSFIALTAPAQLVLNENFTGYLNGNLAGQGKWRSENTGNEVMVNNGSPLTYSTYSCGGSYIHTDHIDGKDAYKPFSTKIVTTSSKTVYMSFVVRINEVISNTGFFYLVLRDTSALTPNIACRFFVQKEPGTGNEIQFGIAVGSGEASYTSTAGSWREGSTYLIVIRYDIVNDGDDRAYLWVDPATTSEPAVNAGNTPSFTVSSTGEVNYGREWNALQVFQSGKYTPAGDLDAFRVAEGATSAIAWNYLGIATAPTPPPLPVEVSFRLSPNPVTNMLEIQYPPMADGHIQIIGPTGKLVKDLRIPANTAISTINMSSMASGVYYVLFFYGPYMSVKKVLKL